MRSNLHWQKWTCLFTFFRVRLHHTKRRDEFLKVLGYFFNLSDSPLRRLGGKGERHLCALPPPFLSCWYKALIHSSVFSWYLRAYFYSITPSRDFGFEKSDFWDWIWFPHHQIFIGIHLLEKKFRQWEEKKFRLEIVFLYYYNNHVSRLLYNRGAKPGFIFDYEVNHQCLLFRVIWGVVLTCPFIL